MDMDRIVSRAPVGVDRHDSRVGSFAQCQRDGPLGGRSSNRVEFYPDLGSFGGTVCLSFTGPGSRGGVSSAGGDDNKWKRGQCESFAEMHHRDWLRELGVRVPVRFFRAQNIGLFRNRCSSPLRAALDLAPWRLQRDPLYFFNSLLGGLGITRDERLEVLRSIDFQRWGKIDRGRNNPLRVLVQDRACPAVTR